MYNLLHIFSRKMRLQQEILPSVFYIVDGDEVKL